MAEQHSEDRFDNNNVHDSQPRTETDPTLHITLAGFYSVMTNMALLNADLSSRVGISTTVGLVAYGLIKALNNPELAERLDK